MQGSGGYKSQITEIESVLDKPMKFLGSIIGSICVPNATFAEIL